MSLDAIGICSKNIPESIEFYSLLGIEFKELGGEGHYEALTRSGLRLMLDSVELLKKIDPKWTDSPGSSIVLCFKQDSVSDVDSIYESIKSAGFKVKKSPWDAFWGQRYASIIDPNGNQIDLFCDQ
ncbi:VOC family protein [Halobacteriovorax sp. HLS]|uniref:VOC family protein n=1 Tax=Halobacteriovorax sp. HLS TaxID=2234000 RepID=UPI000FDC6EB9|nr:VOC family protein [Halobacteriovorax sp. HLS]